MPATAETIRNNQKYRDRLVSTVDGLTGSRVFLVHGATSLVEALTADGLPSFRAAWSPETPTLKAHSFEPVREAGTQNFHVKVGYRQFGDVVDVPPADGLVLTTEMNVERSSETVYYDVAGEKKLSDDGVQKLQVAVSFRVRSYSIGRPDLNALMFLADEPKVNDAAVVLKNLYDSGEDIEVDAGTLLYGGFAVAKQGDFFAVDHDLLWRRGWKYRKVQIASTLEGAAIYDEFDVYEEANFPGVFQP